MDLCSELLNWNKRFRESRRQKRAFYLTSAGHCTHDILSGAKDLNDSKQRPTTYLDG